MRLPVLAAILLAALGGGCGSSRRPVETPAKVATLLRDTWGATRGFPSFDYSCRALDREGLLFTCVVRDRTRTVHVASFDVQCRASRCSWAYYPAYTG